MECEIFLTQPCSVGHAALHHQMAKHHKLRHIKLHLSSKCRPAAHHIQGLRKPETEHIRDFMISDGRMNGMEQQQRGGNEKKNRIHSTYNNVLTSK